MGCCSYAPTFPRVSPPVFKLAFFSNMVGLESRQIQYRDISNSATAYS